MDNDNGNEQLKFTNLEVRDLLLGVGPDYSFIQK